MFQWFLLTRIKRKNAANGTTVYNMREKITKEHDYTREYPDEMESRQRFRGLPTAARQVAKRAFPTIYICIRQRECNTEVKMIHTLDDFIRAYRKICDMGWIPTHRAGPTGIGKTLEDLLGIPENNIDGPTLAIMN